MSKYKSTTPAWPHPHPWLTPEPEIWKSH